MNGGHALASSGCGPGCGVGCGFAVGAFPDWSIGGNAGISGICGNWTP